MASKQHVEILLRQLAPEQMEAVVRLLEVMLDPFGKSIASASVEDEEVKVETLSELDEAHASIIRGEGIPHDEILRQFGFKSRR